MTHLTIPSGTPRISYTGNGVQTAFPVPWPFFATSDNQVYLDGTLQPSGYTITGTSVDGGYQSGICTLTVAPTNGQAVVLVRSTPIARVTDFPYPSAVLDIQAANTEFDRIYALLQDLYLRTNRAIRLPDSEDGAAALLPSATDRANGISGFDGDGNPTIISDVDLTGTTVSTFAAQLLDDANSAAMLATLGTGRVVWCGTAGGTADAQTLTPSPALTTIPAGTIIAWITPASANTGAVTVNPSGLGAKSYLRRDGATMLADDLDASSLQMAISDGTNLRQIDHPQNGTFKAVFLDTNGYLYLGANGPAFVADANDYWQYNRSTNRWEFYSASALAPIRVGAGVKTDDTARMGQGWHLLQSTTISGTPASSSFDLTSCLAAGFTRFKVVWRELLPASAAALYARFSTDAGVNWKSGGADYFNSYFGFNSATSGVGGGSTSVMHLSSATAIESTASGCNGELEWTDRAAGQIARYQSHFVSSAAALTHVTGVATFGYASINAVQLLFNGVNIASGKLSLFGCTD